MKTIHEKGNFKISRTKDNNIAFDIEDGKSWWRFGYAPSRTDGFYIVSAERVIHFDKNELKIIIKQLYEVYKAGR